MDAATTVLLVLAILALTLQPLLFLHLGQRAAGALLAKHYEHAATHQATGEPVHILEKRLALTHFQAETQRKKLEWDAAKYLAGAGPAEVEAGPRDPEGDW